MKHNPRLNEKMARLPGFSDIHPLQPHSTVQGAYELMEELAHWLKDTTGMPAVAMSPKAGAHGELCGLMAMRAAHEARGDARSVVLVPESAHGTNPATAALCGYKVKSIPATEEGRVDLDALKESLDETVAALMLTNPNTCGLFERDMIEIADAVHAAGAYFTAMARTSTPLSGLSAPATLASTPCTSTCTRPSQLPMAAAGQVPALSYFRMHLQRSLRFRGWFRQIVASRSRSRRMAPKPSGGSQPSTGRWACLPVH